MLVVRLVVQVVLVEGMTAVKNGYPPQVKWNVLSNKLVGMSI
jgi:hypothetical protein